MTNDETILIACLWAIALILFFKWYKLKQEIRKMDLITCKVIDKSLRTTYQKNIYTFYYLYIINNEEYHTSDQTRYKLFFFNHQINDELKLYVNWKNPQKVITPLQIVYHNIKLLLALFLFIFPILLFI